MRTSILENVCETSAPYIKKTRDTWYWSAPKSAVKAGYGLRTVRLTDQTSDGVLSRAEQCQSLTRELLNWWNGEGSENQEFYHARRLSYALESAVKTARIRAKKRGWKFQITNEIASQMLKEQGGVCALSGMKLRADKGKHTSFRNPLLPSLDRIDVSRGYEIDNVRIVTAIANMARADFDDEIFFRMCRAVAKRNR